MSALRPLVLALPLLVGCGAADVDGAPATKQVDLRPVTEDGTARGELVLTAHPRGTLDVDATLAGVPLGDYRLRIYDYGSCTLIREKAKNPVLEGSGTRSVLPVLQVIDGPSVATRGEARWNATDIKVRALRGDAEALADKPITLEDDDGRPVACGQINVVQTAAR